MRGSLLAVVPVVTGLWGSPVARAADVIVDVAPGVRHLHRSLTNPRKEIHAVFVDLDTPGLAVRATTESERGQTVSAFAAATGAVAAINGDFFDGSFNTLGLAIGEGGAWANDSESWSFLACTTDNDCTIDTSGAAVAVDPAWRSAVGGNLVILTPGFVWSAADDQDCGPSSASFCTTEHPRSAAGLSADGRTLLLVVVEGRQAFTGMTISALAALMQDLGAATAINLDGGGSSALVVDGVRVTGRPANEPTERTVANHLAVVRRCVAVPPQGGVIDDGDPCLRFGGPPQFIRVEHGGGFDGDLRWTHATDGTSEDNFATWTVGFVTPGRYTLSVFTDARFAESRQTTYVVTHAEGTTSVVLDQTAVDGFQPLGTFSFAASGGSVHVGDNTGEAVATQTQIVFDALRITPAAGEGEGEGGGEGEGEGAGEGEGEGEEGEGEGEGQGEAESEDEPLPTAVRQGCGAGSPAAWPTVGVLMWLRRRSRRTS